MTRSTVRAFGTAAATTILLGSAACGSSTPTTRSAPGSAVASATSTAASASPGSGTGQGGSLSVSAQTKKFMFTITNVEYVASVKDQNGAEVLPRQGSGFQFCVITVTVEHLPGTADGNTFAMTFDDALDASGTTYSNPLGYLDVGPDGVALATQTDFPLDQTLHIKALFEVPPEVKITSLSLSDLDLSQQPVVVKIT